MKIEYTFFSQHICGLVDAQCIGVGSTLKEAARRFDIQKQCMLVSMEYVLRKMESE